jgi:hypothetical protein
MWPPEKINKDQLYFTLGVKKRCTYVLEGTEATTKGISILFNLCIQKRFKRMDLTSPIRGFLEGVFTIPTTTINDPDDGYLSIV